MKSYNLYFFRHGITKGNLNAQYIGHTDLPLTTDSINELHSIKAKYHYPKVDAVFSSPLKRCKDSAEIMFPDNTIITIDDFIEYNFGEFEQCTADDLKDNEDFKLDRRRHLCKNAVWRKQCGICTANLCRI